MSSIHRRLGGQGLNSNSEPIKSCFEHQKLYSADFTDSNDFDHLIMQELPCFSIEVSKGVLCLKVLHYLAKIVLPSGTCLEILPKVSQLNSQLSSQPNSQLSSQKLNSVDDKPPIQSCLTNQDVIQTRVWVATMLRDIAKDNLFKFMPAISLGTEPASDNVSKRNRTNSKVKQSHAFASIMPNQIKSSSSVSRSVSTIKNANNGMTKDLSFESDSAQPWYESLLTLAGDKIRHAASLIPQTYQTKISNNPTAQGKLNLSAQLKQNWHRPHFLYSEQSVFKTDKSLATFLQTAWCQLQTLQKPSYSNRITLSELSGVVALHPSQWLTAYQNIDKNQHIWLTQFTVLQREALIEGIEWGWWLLNHSNQSVSLNSDDTSPSTNKSLPTPALMINMNHAFERWVLGKVALLVLETMPRSELVIRPSFDWLNLTYLPDNQKADNHSTDNNSTDNNSTNNKIKVKNNYHPPSQVIQTIIPDACIRRDDGLITHVIDVKYKVIERIQQVSGADWQQLYVYQSHLNCEQAWLIYPMTAGFTKKFEVHNKSNSTQNAHQAEYPTMSTIPFDIKRGKIVI